MLGLLIFVKLLNTHIMNVKVLTNSLYNSTTNVIYPSIENIAFLVDCGDIDPIQKDYIEKGLTIKSVLLTHGHFDHIYGLNRIVNLFPNIRIYTNYNGKEMLSNSRKNMSYYHNSSFVFDYPNNIIVVKDGAKIELTDGIIARALFTPGHNPSCITWIVGDAVFTGDSLIPGLKTVTNLPGGDKNMAAESKKIIMEIVKGKTIYPGHKV